MRIFTQILHYCIVNAAGHSCFSLRGSNPREQFLTSAQDFFVSKQPIKKFKLIRKSPSILVPRLRRLRDEKRAMGTRMHLEAAITEITLEPSLAACMIKSRRERVGWGGVELAPCTSSEANCYWSRNLVG